MLEHAMSNMVDLSEPIRALLDPIDRQRAAIRDEFERAGAIRPLLDGPSLYPVAAVDGAETCTPLAIGDHLNVLAVAVRSGTGNEPSISGSIGWSDFRAHSAATETLAKAIMMSSEIRLLNTVGEDHVTILDGSHVTPLIAINLALASDDPVVHNTMLDLADDGLLDAIRYATAAPNVVACPKSDSSRDLWQQVATTHDLPGGGVPDKVLAALVLNPGEILVSERATPSWERLYMSFGQIRDPRARAVAQEFQGAVDDLRQGRVQVFHVKPERATTVLRVEVKPDVDGFTTDDYLRALADDCAPPHIQEPLAQYVADIVAKQVSSVANVQMEKARLDLAQAGLPEHYQEYLMRGYRT